MKKLPPPPGTYHSRIVTWAQDQEHRRTTNISKTKRERWQGHTPTQRKAMIAHLHTPQVKAKARSKADAVYRSAEYRAAQSERMRLWHLRRWYERFMAAGGAAALSEKRSL